MNQYNCKINSILLTYPNMLADLKLFFVILYA